jgi:iron complex outermembrane receptor protein
LRDCLYFIGWRKISVVAFALVAIQIARSQSTDQTQSQTANPGTANVLSQITVTGTTAPIDLPNVTGSRLALSPRELPATIDSIDANTIMIRGYTTADEAVDSLPGVTSGGSPGDPAQFSMRGFTSSQITILHDGLYIGPASMVNRSQNAYNLYSIDILKGPASILYGQGAVGGTVNYVDKAPDFSRNFASGLFAFGSYGTYNYGISGGAHLGNTFAIRADYSYNSSSGYIERDHTWSMDFTASALWTPLSNVQVLLSFEYAADRPSNYYGTPLLPVSFATEPLQGVVSSRDGLTIDRRTRYNNYNVNDYEFRSNSYWPRILIKWQPTDNTNIQNLAYYYHADREWRNSESYVFNPTTQLIDRDRFFVYHTQELYGDQLSGSIDFKLGPCFDDRFLVGLDYYHLNFYRSRGFPNGDSVDVFHPAAGSFGPTGVPLLSPTYMDDLSGFFENILTFNKALKFVSGFRYGLLDLNRKNFNADGSFNASTSFERTFYPLNWRVGLLYDVTPTITPYISWSTGQDPAGSDIFLVNAGENFNLSSSNQLEIGVKASTPDGNADLTVAFYDIHRNNMLTQTGLNTVSTGGAQKTRGVEVSANWKIFPWWNINANAAYTDAHFIHFVDNNTGLNDTGKRPADVPKWTANLWCNFPQIGGWPIDLGFGIQYVGDRYGNNSDTLTLKKYTLVNLYASYHVTPYFTVSAHIYNLFDKAYAQWADVFYPSEVILGPPTTYQISATLQF